MFVQYFWRKAKRETERGKKNVSYFSPFQYGRVRFSDISTEACVLQPLLPDALIESPMSNRKGNKCFIELELSLVIVAGRTGRTGWG